MSEGSPALEASDTSSMGSEDEINDPVAERALKEANAMMEFKKLAKRESTNGNLVMRIRDLNLTHLSTALTGRPTIVHKDELCSIDASFVKHELLSYEHPTEPGTKVPHRQ